MQVDTECPSFGAQVGPDCSKSPRRVGLGGVVVWNEVLACEHRPIYAEVQPAGVQVTTIEHHKQMLSCYSFRLSWIGVVGDHVR